MNAPTWSPEMTTMVKSLSEAETRFRREQKRAWSRASISEQADYLLTALSRNRFGIAENSVIARGRIEQRRDAEERKARGVEPGAPDPDGMVGVG